MLNARVFTCYSLTVYRKHYTVHGYWQKTYRFRNVYIYSFYRCAIKNIFYFPPIFYSRNYIKNNNVQRVARRVIVKVPFYKKILSQNLFNLKILNKDLKQKKKIPTWIILSIYNWKYKKRIVFKSTYAYIINSILLLFKVE